MSLCQVRSVSRAAECVSGVVQQAVMLWAASHQKVSHEGTTRPAVTARHDPSKQLTSVCVCVCEGETTISLHSLCLERAYTHTHTHTHSPGQQPSQHCPPLTHLLSLKLSTDYEEMIRLLKDDQIIKRCVGHVRFKVEEHFTVAC